MTFKISFLAVLAALTIVSTSAPSFAFGRSIYAQNYAANRGALFSHWANRGSLVSLNPQPLPPVAIGR